jgi:hypothetical protein
MDTPGNYSRQSVAWRSGLSGTLYLGLGVPLLLVGAVALSGLVPRGHALAAAAPALLLIMVMVGCGLAGALWGRSLARLAGLHDARRIAWASGLAFGPLTMAAMLVLTRVEFVFVEQRLMRGVPIHIIFAIAFTASAFFVTTGVALAAGWTARGRGFGLQSALCAGLAAALAFLLADMVQDLLGRRVGGPGAERTATMLTVAFISNIIAAFAGSAVMGWRLRRGGSATVSAHPQMQEAVR